VTSAATRAPDSLVVAGVDDMHDAPADLQRPGPLGDYLRLCDPRPGTKINPANSQGELSLREAFDVADGMAKQGQDSFRKLTRRAAWLGMFALIAMVIRLTLGEEFFKHLAESAERQLPARLAPAIPFFFPTLEASFAFASCFFVLRGLLKFRHEEWLIQRFKAERHRLLKFRILIDPRTWASGEIGTDEWKQELQHEVQRISNLSHLSMDEIGIGQDVPRLPPPEIWEKLTSDPAGRLLEEIVAYYRHRRLDTQIAYFLGKASGHVPAIGNRRLSPMLFFGGVACVFVAFLFEFVRLFGDQPALRVLTVLFVICGGAAPAVSAAIRTIRSAYEWGRNAERSSAMHATLAQIGRHLYSEQVARKGAPQNIFAYLSISELTLATDQREWIRLMGEAEWYG
jgi:hypothetical protein